ncbi:hypothetical protein ACSU64_27995 [Bacillaceae bacterium C204]|uniref:hypothetical protein n=1 Tax=Neobacillus sp. 204 TaxID=3383351 RepID=UPI00397C4388
MKKIPIIESFLSIISCWWAIVLFNQDDFFRVPKVYEGLAVLGQFGWGSVFLLAAFLKIFGILTEKARLREIGLMFSTLLYGLICAGYILSGDGMSTGTGVYFALCVLAFYQIREVKAYAN